MTYSIDWAIRNGYSVLFSNNDPACPIPYDGALHGNRYRLNGTWVGCDTDSDFQSKLDAYIDSTLEIVNPGAFAAVKA